MEQVKKGYMCETSICLQPSYTLHEFLDDEVHCILFNMQVTFTELSDSNEGHLASCLIFALSKEGNSNVSKMRDQLLLALALNQTEYAAEVILNSRNPQHQSVSLLILFIVMNLDWYNAPLVMTS